MSGYQRSSFVLKWKKKKKEMHFSFEAIHPWDTRWHSRSGWETAANCVVKWMIWWSIILYHRAPQWKKQVRPMGPFGGYSLSLITNPMTSPTVWIVCHYLSIVSTHYLLYCNANTDSYLFIFEVIFELQLKSCNRCPSYTAPSGSGHDLYV